MFIQIRNRLIPWVNCRSMVRLNSSSAIILSSSAPFSLWSLFYKRSKSSSPARIL